VTLAMLHIRTFIVAGTTDKSELPEPSLSKQTNKQTKIYKDWSVSISNFILETVFLG
jgi:hypothetical protein